MEKSDSNGRKSDSGGRCVPVYLRSVSIFSGENVLGACGSEGAAEAAAKKRPPRGGRGRNGAAEGNLLRDACDSTNRQEGDEIIARGLLWSCSHRKRYRASTFALAR
jgi:hypothetical protein